MAEFQDRLGQSCMLLKILTMKEWSLQESFSTEAQTALWHLSIMSTRNCIIVFMQDFIEYKQEMRDILQAIEWLCKNGIQNKS